MSGDITQVSADALTTLINPEGAWFGGVDQAIHKAAGNRYHYQAAKIKGYRTLSHGDVIMAYGTRQAHEGQFDNVIFVVDNLETELNTLVTTALVAAQISGFKFISLPLMRTGVMIGLVEKTIEEVAKQMATGISVFARMYPESPMLINVVVYNRNDLPIVVAATR